MDDAKREKLGEVIRFGIVGGLATVLQYVIYLAMMPALAHFIVIFLQEFDFFIR